MGKGVMTRARILDEAIRMASVDGVGGLTIGRLAVRTGMSKSGLFAHFRAKEDIEVAVLQEAIERFRETVVGPASLAPRGEPRLRALVERWLAWTTESPSQPGGCVLMRASAELNDQPGRPRDVIAESQRAWLTLLEQAAALAIEVGHFRRDLDARLFAFQLHGTLLATYHAQRLLKDPDAPVLLARALDTLITQARARAGRSSR